MSLNNFIPAVWAGNLLANLNNAHVFAQAGMVNRDYEGEIRASGDRVKINQIGRVTIFDYTKNTDMPAPEVLTDNQRELIINQAKAFNFVIDDVDKAQTQPKVMGEATKEAAYALSDVADRYVAGLYVGAGSNLGSTVAPETLATPAEAYDLLVELGILLDENKAAGPRQVAVPPWFVGQLARDDRFIKTGSAGAESTLRNGFSGQAAGFDIVKSNNVPTAVDGTAGTSFKIQASTPQARSFAEQIVETEAYRPERRFGDALKGLHVYGGKVIRPEALVVAHVKRPA
ncbi:P22 phage major capsid protein family protein [Blastococcus sp. CT_GayMR16]|uniref:P22 phage major capsid protein family protein n=1 Tax=Blastococcus sp. CT_GayMR16 TaxID=2559607 RepID=UPI0010742209|nr:P22 phage major capsid protein family protein [Blastococcus sp. CT_GayMR16]TFV91401.1 P22 coat protein - protein 5 domain protein [Blastococcus sp. CT_GayMR16]